MYQPPLSNRTTALYVALILATIGILVYLTFWVEPISYYLILAALVVLLLEIALWFSLGYQQKHVATKPSHLNPKQIEKYRHKLKRIAE